MTGNLPNSLEFLIRHGYSVLFLSILAEQGALPLPSVPFLLLYGALARAGKLNLFLAILCGLCACLIADNRHYVNLNGRREVRSSPLGPPIGLRSASQRQGQAGRCVTFAGAAWVRRYAAASSAGSGRANR